MANLQNTSFETSLELPQGTTGQRPSSPTVGMIRFNTDIGAPEVYDGNNWSRVRDSSPLATGGTVVHTDVNGIPYRIHYFTSIGNSTLTVTSGGEFEYLIVAGGGGGGSSPNNPNDACGGGGAGGFLTGTTTLTPGTYTISVGDGGDGINASLTPGTDGSNSSAFGLTTTGGGGGATQTTAGRPGGSGGGAGNGGGTGPYAGGTGVSGQGFAGGNVSTGSNNWIGAGGGGAGEPGRSGNQGTAGQGYGGNGRTSNITGITKFYAGGGAGGEPGGIRGGGGGTAPEGFGGLGGGADGGSRDDATDKAPNGWRNTGGGGGGAMGYTSDFGGDGGAGIVIVRYKGRREMPTPNRTSASNPVKPYDVSKYKLVLSFDANDPISYPGTGTTWFNQTGYNLNASGNPAFSDEQGGYFTIDGNQFSVPDSADLDLTGTRTLTLWLWLSQTANCGFAGKSNSSVQGLALGYGWSDGGFMALAWNSSNGPALSRDANRDLQKWVYLAAVIDNSNNRIIYAFDNQGVRSSSAGAASQSWNNSLPFGIGASDGNGNGRAPAGTRVGYCSVYNRALSQAELQQNFEATRWRFNV